MRALVVTEFGGPEKVHVVDVPVPEPRPGEVRVRVAAAGLDFADVLARTGSLVEYGATRPRDQYGLGTEFAGTVDSVGAGVATFALGDAVIGAVERLDVRTGAQADYVVVDAWALAPAPAGLSVEQAAGLPLPGLTALQALDTLALKPGEWLLVTGAAGGVGGYAVELAVLRGLRVVAQASTADETLLRGFGAEVFVDRDAHLADSVRDVVPGGVHGVIDCANLGVQADDAVRHGGAFVALLNNAPASRREIRTYNVAWHADPGRLAQLSALAGAGHLTVRVAASFPVEEARQAHEALARGGHRGRLVLTFSAGELS